MIHYIPSREWKKFNTHVIICVRCPPIHLSTCTAKYILYGACMAILGRNNLIVTSFEIEKKARRHRHIALEEKNEEKNKIIRAAKS